MSHAQLVQDEAELVAWLMKPESYPHRPKTVECIETHISRVFLAGDEVFKLKKRVKYDFLDFSTLSAREHACREELRLNRRLARDVYCDVVAVSRRTDGVWQWGESSLTADWLVHMRRMPMTQTLDALHHRGELTPSHVDSLANLLLDFYRSLPALQITPAEYRDRCFAHVQGNYRELLAVQHHLPRGVVERVHGFQLQLLSLQPMLFEERVNHGCVIDGHGDLRPEHIVFSDPPAIFDCIEFNSEFRQIDELDELAFLIAECDFLGAKWVGEQLLDRYRRATKIPFSDKLLAFYKSYRSCVRAKVAALRADQLEGPAQATFAEEASRHLMFADQYVTQFVRPVVIVVGGLSGSGKSTLAAELAQQLGCEWLRTDVVRQELSPLPSNTEKYSSEMKARVYAQMIQLADRWLEQKISVVLDGTFGTNRDLRRAWDLAQHHSARFLAVECCCPPEVAKMRIQNRLLAGQDPSEARPETYDLQKAQWERWSPEIPQISVPADRSIPHQIAAVFAGLRTNSAET